MHSFLLLSSNEKKLSDKAAEICASMAISSFDQVLLQKEKNIGIEDIRQLQKNLSLAPLQGSHKAAIVFNADTMSIDAQNAFLKTLEEPPAHTILILLAKDKEAFLPTVLSRCHVQEIPDDQLLQKIPAPELIEQLAFMRHASIGERLALAEKIGKSKDAALSWTIEAQHSLRDVLHKTLEISDVRTIRKLQEAQKTLAQTNANTRAVLEQLFLSL